ncbi:MAG: LrgB family protein [Butyricicoccaceae bacterium]
MQEILNKPFLWIALSVLTYEIGLIIQRRVNNPAANPLLISMLLMIAILVGTHTSLDTYNTGGDFIAMCLSPATVVLAVPIFRQMEVLRRNLLPILAGALVGSLVSMCSVFFLCRAFGLSDDLTASLIPKSVTTAIAQDVSSVLGGIPSVTVICVVLTGILGAIALPSFLKFLRVQDPVATGIAIGTAAHAVGTSRAIQLGETEGAMSGLAIGIAGIITAILASVLPFFA